MIHTNHPSIFVSIASYRDPDCQNTVNDLFEKAAFPDRLVMGICLQIVPGEDEDCRIVSGRPEQLRIMEVHASESRGACWARSRIQSLWQGEDYFFQVDSHMRFVQNWDEKLIAMMGKCAGEKAVISTYPLDFTPPDQFAPDNLVILHPKGFDDDGVLTQASTLSSLDKAPEKPAPNPFVAGGLLFTLGRVVDEVPYDPYLYFTGEEITLAVRLWTSGWDIYSPNEVLAYHIYSTQTGRPRHWNDQTDWTALSRRAARRLQHLLGMESVKSDAVDLVEIEKYSLGTTRTLAEYEAYSGLNFKGHLFKEKLLPKVMADDPERIASRSKIFSGIWKDNFWGDAESRSGSGSTLTSTTTLRAWLPKTLDSLGVRILGDAGCGDLNWMKALAKPLRFYFGYDLVPEMIDDLRNRFKDQPNYFFSVADVVMETLPECDAILCRDTLTHLTPDAALLVLKGFRRSGSRFLIATSHSIGKNVWINTGGWYAMDLTAAPFNLPPPLFSFMEGKTKSLGVWAISDLPE